jgi:hypothetical protein
VPLGTLCATAPFTLFTRLFQESVLVLIRSTSHACYVILRNGLTLELFYDDTLKGTGDDRRELEGALPKPSQGVWLMGESVLFEVHAGQA